MSTYRVRRSPISAPLAAVVVVVVLVAVLIIAFVVDRGPSAPSSSGGARTNAGSTSAKTQTAEALSSSSPAAGQTGVSPAGPITLHLTEPLAAGSPLPTITPGVSGSWSLTSASTLKFDPKASLVPFQKYTVTVPGGPDGIRAVSGSHLASSVKFTFQVAGGSFLRLQQLLAELGYLPVSFTPTSSAPVPATEEAIAQLGTFSWRWQNLPEPLTSLFIQGDDDVLTQGAVMMFEDLHNLAADGIAGPEVWTALLEAVATHQTDPNPWDWVYVNKNLPETLYVWRDGKLAFQTFANTGAVGFATPNGSWPVYLHYPSTTMQGTNPNGTHYDDANVLWVSYFYRGDALHAFLRAGYGFPQSLGCVEMPTAAAATVYPYTPIGTVVTIQ